MNITDWSWELERKPELCSFLMLDADPHCVVCGKPCTHGLKQYHAGPVIRVSGWLETPECHEIIADVWHGLRLPKRDGQATPDILIFVSDRTIPIRCGADPKAEIIYRYSFAGSRFVGANEELPTDVPVSS